MTTIRSATLLDRVAHKRTDADYLSSLALAAGARFLVLVNGRALVRSNADRTETAIFWLNSAELLATGLAIETKPLFLGVARDDGGGRFALPVLVPEPPPGETLRVPGLPGALVDLRSLAMQGSMAPDGLSLIGQALMLANWQAQSRFCGRCGGPNGLTDGGWKLTCSSCGAGSFPRIDPVVIMLVEDGARAVLSREARFPDGMVSTLAGFIEPGEDFFHAVRRETREEIGVETTDVQFIASQPWPFPHSLMIGCIARAVTSDLRPDPTEIVEARWYEPAEVRQILNRKPGEGGTWLPGGQSLANKLVRTWLENVEKA